jgi:hypothetical protein
MLFKSHMNPNEIGGGPRQKVTKNRIQAYPSLQKQKDDDLLLKDTVVDRRRDRTCNLLIRSQAPCHWASRPIRCWRGACQKICISKFWRIFFCGRRSRPYPYVIPTAFLRYLQRYFATVSERYVAVVVAEGENRSLICLS